jgi:hypothetical protein
MALRLYNSPSIRVNDFARCAMRRAPSYLPEGPLERDIRGMEFFVSRWIRTLGSS